MADPQIGKSRIPELLMKKGKEQLDLAIHLGVSKQFLSQVIKGKDKLSITKAKKAADYFGVKIDDLNEWVYPEGYEKRE